VAKVASGMIAAFDGGCAGAGPSCGFSGWKTMSGGGDERDSRHREAPRARPGSRRDRDRVADSRLKRRCELLVEHHRARPQAALQEAETC